MLFLETEHVIEHAIENGMPKCFSWYLLLEKEKALDPIHWYWMLLFEGTEAT